MKKQITRQEITEVKKLLKLVLETDEYTDIQRMGGLTNKTYYVKLTDGQEYVARIPGEGTEALIIRDHERISTELACCLGVDVQLLHFGKDGTKLTKYIPNAITMSADTISSEENLSKVAEIFRRLHSCGIDTGVPFEVFDMADGYEKIITELKVPLFEDYYMVKLKQILQVDL